MKLEFKFSFVNFVAFILLGGLFYGLCPLPGSTGWRWVVCALVGLVLFGLCFVVVSHRSFIRPAPAQTNRKSSKPARKK